MQLSVRIAPFVLLSALLAGCGDETGDVASRTTTTADDAGTGTTPPTDLEAVPDDDGGALCAALEEWDRTFDAAGDTASPNEAGRVFVEAAGILTDDVIDVAPDDMRADIEAFAAAMVAAGDELQAYDGDETDIDELLLDESLTELQDLMELATPQAVPAGNGSTTYAYVNRLSAWAAEPCGPKALALGDEDLSFEPVGDSI